MIYGATGFTGRLIVSLAAEYGLRPIIAGRDPAAVRALASAYGLEPRAFPLAGELPLDGVSVVLHCAGPFSRTSAPMATACIRRGVHYVDITGEIEVFEALHARTDEARTAGIMLLPGAGFDVVPSDCLAAHLKQRLPTATWLTLGIGGTGRLSRGTVSTMVEHAGRGGMIRRDGRLTSVPVAWKTRRIDFGRGPRTAVTIPWGDVATSFYSTGIPNVEVYSVVPARARPLMMLMRHMRGLLRRRAVRRLVQRLVRAAPPGPDATELYAGASFVWGEVTDDHGNSAQALIHGPNGYLLTARAALLVMQRVLDGHAPPGFQTPSLAYGPDFVLEIPGIRRSDL